jgi:hypothetical protein
VGAADDANVIRVASVNVGTPTSRTANSSMATSRGGSKRARRSRTAPPSEGTRTIDSRSTDTGSGDLGRGWGARWAPQFSSSSPRGGEGGPCKNPNAAGQVLWVDARSWGRVDQAPVGRAFTARWENSAVDVSDLSRGMAAAISTAVGLDLAVDDAIVLHNSNRLALRLLPCDVLARVAPVGHEVAEFEVDLAQRRSLIHISEPTRH